MASFKNEPDEWQRLDYMIFQNGWTSLYCKQNVLNEDIEWFRQEKYRIVEFDCTKWEDLSLIHGEIKKQLQFPDYYGRNFDALDDCLSDIEIIEPGFIIVFRHFQFVGKDVAHTLLDIFARSSREHLLFGERLLTLVQVDNPDYQIDDVGSCSVLWNGAEWPKRKL